MSKKFPIDTKIPVERGRRRWNDARVNRQAGDLVQSKASNFNGSLRFERLEPELPAGIELGAVTVRETERNSATYTS